VPPTVAALMAAVLRVYPGVIAFATLLEISSAVRDETLRPDEAFESADVMLMTCSVAQLRGQPGVTV
jgi:hypothetical protein